MSFQWLEMRIQEEKDRRQKEALTLERLPGALEEVCLDLTSCIASYREAFGAESAEVEQHGSVVRILIRDQEGGKWQVRAKVEISMIPSLPGLQIDRGDGEPLTIVVGILPGEKLFFRDQDEYIAMEELSRRILDRALFPRLTE